MTRFSLILRRGRGNEVCMFRDANPVSVVEWDWDGEDKVIRPPVNLAFLQGWKWKTLCKVRNFGKFRSYDMTVVASCYACLHTPTPTLQV